MIAAANRGPADEKIRVPKPCSAATIFFSLRILQIGNAVQCSQSAVQCRIISGSSVRCISNTQYDPTCHHSGATIWLFDESHLIAVTRTYLPSANVHSNNNTKWRARMHLSSSLLCE